MSFNSSVTRLFAVLFVFMMLVFAGCSSDSSSSASDTGDTTEPAEPTAAQLAIGVSSASVQSDNSEAITVTASVLDESSVALEGATVNFRASGGVLSLGEVLTGTDGLATVDFSSGLNDKSNRQVTITASVTGLPDAQVPVQITGTTIQLSSLDSSALTIGGGDEDRLRISLTDAGGLPIFNATVTISISDTSTGMVSVSSESGVTDVSGELQVDVTAASVGTATVNVEAAGALASQDYLVQATGNAFAIVSPTEDPGSLSTAQSISIVVDSPSPGPSNMVVMATTVGTLTSGDVSGSVINIPVVDGRAEAFLTSTMAGIATIQASDFNDSSLFDSTTVAIFAPSSQARQITLQSSNTNVAPSSATVNNTVTLFASVTNDADQVVGEAPVLFTLSNSTGGGETLSPAIAYTDSSGTATTTFTSGSLSSDAEGVTVRATVLGSAPVLSDDVAVIIGGTAGSVVVGSATEVTTIADETAYQLAMSVVVADSNGNPVPGAQVSLSLWPYMYATGSFVADPDKEWFENEDLNRNLILDPGEDIRFSGELTPPSSSAGTIPATVTTDEFGVGTFTLTYLKSYAGYIAFELTASTLVLGSETSSTFLEGLGWAVADEPYLGSSPFNIGN